MKTPDTAAVFLHPVAVGRANGRVVEYLRHYATHTEFRFLGSPTTWQCSAADAALLTADGVATIRCRERL